MLTEEKKENREFIVWSIIMGLLLGFVVTIFSNIYYDMFIVRDITWVQVDHSQFALCMLGFLSLVGYLMFFIADYPHTFEFSKAYWKRYQRYFFYSFLPGKILRYIIGFYLILFLVGLLVLIYYFMALNFGYLYGTIIFVAIILLAYLKERLNRNHA